MIETGNVMLAFVLTLLAGLAMAVGSMISFIGKKTNKKFLSASLGFASGVMIYVAFVEIFMESRESLSEIYGGSKGILIAVISFFAGMVFMVLTEKFCLKENEDEEESDYVDGYNPDDYTDLDDLEDDDDFIIITDDDK